MIDPKTLQTLMIVDDNPVNIHILIEAVGDQYDTIFALNGNDALEMAARAVPDLILLDIQMPEMSGYEVCKTLKSNPKLKDIPIIFITAMSQQEDEICGLELGASDYITKPFNMTVVRLRVKAQMELRRHKTLLEQRTHELEEALASIRVLREILPICMFCKKIRDDEGYWSQLEQYVREHTDSEFSHGICPECMREQYGDEMADLFLGPIKLETS